MHCFILAGGFATRLWPLTERRAKPLLPLAGKPILTHLIEKIPLKIPVTVSTNAAFREDFERWRDSLARPDVRVQVEESTRDDGKLGALGATAEWLQAKKIDEDVLLLTGDNYLGFSMDAFLAAYSPSSPLLAVYDIGDSRKASDFGTVIVKNASGPIREIAAFEEKPMRPKTSLVSTGCSILPKDTFPMLIAYADHHADNVGGIFEEFIRQGLRLECFTFAEPWLDIGSFASYLAAHRLLVQGKRILQAGAEWEESASVGSVVVGRGSAVRSSTLEDTMVFENCEVQNCRLRDCIIDDGCRLQNIDFDGKMLRANTNLTRDLSRLDCTR